MSATGPAEGELLFEPSAERIRSSRLTEFAEWLARRNGVEFASYEDLWRFSVTDLRGFWSALAEFFRVRFHAEPRAVLEGTMPAAHWFPGATLSYAEHALAAPDETVAIVFRSEDHRRVQWSFGELKEQVARARTGLSRLGVQKGDRVAALLPNRPETVALFLATASLGAIWSSASPEFGVSSILDRFRQIEPRVFISVDGYRYGGKIFDRAADVRSIAEALPGAPAVVILPEVHADQASVGLASAISYAELTAERGELAFEPVPFAHPLWILYSSGTTGLPKPIVHGHGGILLEHLKALALHSDIGKGDRFFWYSTTGWMMWNYLVSGLCLGATIVLYDGSPAYPGLDTLWKLADEERISYFGASAPFLLACKKAGLEPRKKHGFDALKALGTTGAPLPADGFGWVYDAVKRDLVLASVSGGTDVCTAFVLSCPWLPVRAGEIQCRGLGAKIEAFDAAGEPVTGEVGELVLTEPLPSMPTGFWGDSDGSRFRESYFSVYPGIWRHGDWIKLTERGSCIIYGRSDSTLNRGGVRMGTSEFYRVIEALPEIADSLVVDTGSLESDAIGKLWLFVVLADGVTLTHELERQIKARVRSDLSPRHVPDEIVAVHAVPRTINGKKLEVPVKRILLGTPADKAASRDTLADPSALDVFVEMARSVRA